MWNKFIEHICKKFNLVFEFQINRTDSFCFSYFLERNKEEEEKQNKKKNVLKKRSQRHTTEWYRWKKSRDE
jgi:hypothetical protein